MGKPARALVLWVHYEGAFQAEGHCRLRRHADFFAPGEQLGERTAASSCEGSNTGASASPKHRPHQGADACTTAGEFRCAAVGAETAPVTFRH